MFWPAFVLNLCVGLLLAAYLLRAVRRFERRADAVMAKLDQWHAAELQKFDLARDEIRASVREKVDRAIAESHAQIARAGEKVRTGEQRQGGADEAATGECAPSFLSSSQKLFHHLKVDNVSRLDPTEPRAVDADTTAADAVAALRELGIGCLLVTESGRVVGIFTERDLLTRVLAPGRPLDTPMRVCMTADPVTVSPKDSVRTVVERMQKGGYRHLPVVDEAGRPVGILSARRVVHYLVEHFPTLVFNLPPEPDRYPQTAEGE